MLIINNSLSLSQVHYAQQRIEEMNEKLGLGTYYVKEKASEAKTFVIDKKAETEKMITEQVTKTNALLKENANKVWENVYSTTMYIPSKAIKISGEVFVSTKEIVFAFSQVSEFLFDMLLSLIKGILIWLLFVCLVPNLLDLYKGLQNMP